MNQDIYRYRFFDAAPMAEVRDTLHLATFSTEGLFGKAQVRLDAGFHIDERQHACVIDATTPVGRAVAQVFTSLLVRQFGEDAFSVERVGTDEPHRPDGGWPWG